MQLVLYRCKEAASNLSILVVVDRTLSVDIGDLLIEPAFAGANVADAFKHLVEVILTKEILRILQTLVIHGKPLDDVLSKNLRCPDAEGSRTFRIDAVADCDDSIKIVEFRPVALAIRGSCQQIVDN